MQTQLRTWCFPTQMPWWEGYEGGGEGDEERPREVVMRAAPGPCFWLVSQCSIGVVWRQGKWSRTMVDLGHMVVGFFDSIAILVEIFLLPTARTALALHAAAVGQTISTTVLHHVKNRFFQSNCPGYLQRSHWIDSLKPCPEAQNSYAS